MSESLTLEVKGEILDAIRMWAILICMLVSFGVWAVLMETPAWYTREYADVFAALSFGFAVYLLSLTVGPQLQRVYRRVVGGSHE